MIGAGLAMMFGLGSRAVSSSGVRRVPTGVDTERFPLDAPKQLVDERRRLDALSDLQRYKGCTVMEPGPAVVEERARLEGSIVRPAPPAIVLKSRG